MQFNAHSVFKIFRSKDYTVEPILSFLEILRKRQNILFDIVFLKLFLSKYNRVEFI